MQIIEVIICPLIDVLYLVIELFKALFAQCNSRGEKRVFYNKLFPYFCVCLKGNFYCVCPSDFGHISQNDFWIFPLHVKIKTHKKLSGFPGLAVLHFVKFGHL